MRFLLYFALVTIAAVARSAPPPAVQADFPFEYREGLLWVEVTVPQSERPLQFLMDTGAGATVIDLTTAKRLGLKLGRPVYVRGVHSLLTGYWLRGLTAQVGNVDLPREPLAVDLAKLSNSCQRRVDGLVGADFFRGRTVQIDFDAARIWLLERQQIPIQGDVLALQLRPCGMRVPIRVDGRKSQWVRLDTGCASALEWVASHVNADQCSRRLAIGLTEISIPQTRSNVGIGRHEFEDVPTGLHRTPIFAGEAGLLGNGILSRFSTVTIDARAGRVILGARSTAH